LDPDTTYYTRGHTLPRSVHPAYQQPRCSDAATPDDRLPERQTCPMPYHSEPGVDRVEHSGNAGSKFYVVCPGRVQGTYVSE
jgi:hypothetical protein